MAVMWTLVVLPPKSSPRERDDAPHALGGNLNEGRGDIPDQDTGGKRSLASFKLPFNDTNDNEWYRKSHVENLAITVLQYADHYTHQ